jgi:uncharacterized membrane protein YedE/YeeE
MTLGELQVDLLKADMEDALTASTRPVTILVGGVALGLSSVPILLIAVAHAFREWLGFSWAASYFVAALIGLAIAVAAIVVGWRLLRKGLAAFERSQVEFRRNLTWLKQSLSQTSSDDRNCEQVH